MHAWHACTARHAPCGRAHPAHQPLFPPGWPLQVIARSLPNQELQGIKEMFKAIDEDGSGCITVDELREGLRKKGAALGVQEVRGLAWERAHGGDPELHTCMHSHAGAGGCPLPGAEHDVAPARLQSWKDAYMDVLGWI